MIRYCQSSNVWQFLRQSHISVVAYLLMPGCAAKHCPAFADMTQGVVRNMFIWFVLFVTGIKEITANFGLDPEMPFVANVDDLLIEEEALNNPGDITLSIMLYCLLILCWAPMYTP